ncbi:MAG: PHP domain-containing protein [Lachnospiraceae bacterium]|nr:PHP domain-containing protein [Lachnospiraceae bacterium]
MKYCDLHCHSCYSDGTLTPAELIRLAEKKGLGALALTDHNTANGLPEFMAAGRDSTVIPVPGCEFTTDHNGRELHIVGLFFEERYWPEIEDYVELAHIAKHNANLRLMAALQQGGYDVHYEEAAALTDAVEFNRAHVARLLFAKGYVSSVTEAFQTILKEGAGYYTPPRRLPSIGTIRFIKQYGAVAVFAHPFLNMNEEELLDFLPRAKEAGLDAMETRYTEYNAETTRKAEELAARFGLKQSGGSDFHGAAKPLIDLGTGWGGLKVPFSFYEDLKP